MAKKHNNRGGNNSKGNKAMKYMVRADIKVNGTVQRKDIIGLSWAKQRAYSEMNWS